MTTQLENNHCILTAMVPVSKNIVRQGQFSWEPKQPLQNKISEVLVYQRQGTAAELLYGLCQGLSLLLSFIEQGLRT